MTHVAREFWRKTRTELWGERWHPVRKW
jgi:hypothetical protein